MDRFRGRGSGRALGGETVRKKGDFRSVTVATLLIGEETLATIIVLFLENILLVHESRVTRTILYVLLLQIQFCTTAPFRNRLPTNLP